MRVKSEVKNPENFLPKITPSHTYNGVNNEKAYQIDRTFSSQCGPNTDQY